MTRPPSSYSYTGWSPGRSDGGVSAQGFAAFCRAITRSCHARHGDPLAGTAYRPTERPYRQQRRTLPPIALLSNSAQQCWRILAHPRPFNPGLPRLDGELGVDWRAKVDLFERLHWEHEFGIDTIAGVAAKFGVHRRIVRQAVGSAVLPMYHYPPRIKPEAGRRGGAHRQSAGRRLPRTAEATPHRPAAVSPDPDGIPGRHGR